jgi:hypothetical protein
VYEDEENLIGAGCYVFGNKGARCSLHRYPLKEEKIGVRNIVI